jgi:hypothetical protein
MSTTAVTADGRARWALGRRDYGHAPDVDRFDLRPAQLHLRHRDDRTQMTSPNSGTLLGGGFHVAVGIKDAFVSLAQPGQRTFNASRRTAAHGAPVRTDVAVPR